MKPVDTKKTHFGGWNFSFFVEIQQPSFFPFSNQELKNNTNKIVHEN
jgi:hypothetical protein